MPPKRTRRAGAAARSEASIIFGHSSPSVSNQPLPDVPTQPSWAYGSPAAPVLPRRLVAKDIGLAEVAESIDQTIRDAEKRDRRNDPDEANDTDDRPHMNTRSRRRPSAANASPVAGEPSENRLQIRCNCLMRYARRLFPRISATEKMKRKPRDLLQPQHLLSPTHFPPCPVRPLRSFRIPNIPLCQ